MDVLTPEQRRKNMQAIKSKNTKIELILGKAMWTLGIRYRKNDKTIIGKPDFVMKGLKIAIFCDSEFFHGKNWNIKRGKITVNREFWIKKIERNIERDNTVNKELTEKGWTVIRFWGDEIKKNLDDCVNLIIQTIEIKKTQKKYTKNFSVPKPDSHTI